MLRVYQSEDICTSQFNHFLRYRQYSSDWCIIGLLNLLLQTHKIQLGEDLVDHEQYFFHLKLACHLHCDGGSLKILLVGAQDQHQDIGNEEREQGFFIQAGMGINEKVIEA